MLRIKVSGASAGDTCSTVGPTCRLGHIGVCMRSTAIRLESPNGSDRLEPTLRRCQVEWCARSLEHPPIVAPETIDTRIATRSCDQVYNDVQVLL